MLLQKRVFPVLCPLFPGQSILNTRVPAAVSDAKVTIQESII